MGRLTQHPAGLPVLFMTEVWERFGFYIAQGLLILYMTKYFGFSDTKSAGILGSFTALAYIMPVAGGFLADHVYGYRRAIFIGGALLVLGYALLAVPNTHVFYTALGVIVLGTGLFKPNVSSLVGALYDKDHAKRDAGFTIFYVGINLGILLSTSTTGFVHRTFGWYASFLSASVGLMIGLLTFYWGLPKLEGKGHPPKTLIKARWIDFFNNRWGFGSLLVVLTGILGVLFLHNQIADFLFAATGIGLIITLVYLSFGYDRKQRNCLLALLILIGFAVIFWSVFFQMFFSTNLFIDRIVQRHIGGLTIPTVAFISLEALFIITCGPFFASLWQWLAKRDLNPRLPTKFAWGLLLIALGFYLMAQGLVHHNAAGQVQPLWVVGGYFFITMGEIFLSPIGLSAVIRLSPPKIVGMMMGVWFFSLGYGGDIAGIIAKWADIPKGTTDLFKMGAVYHTAFMRYTWIAGGFGVLLVLLIPWLKKMVGHPSQDL